MERILSTVDSVILIVDANEGPMPQTRYVLKHALSIGMRPLVFVNKVDRDGADPKGALNQTRIAVIVEEAEESVEADVDARRLNETAVEGIELDPPGVEAGADIAVTEEHGAIVPHPCPRRGADVAHIAGLVAARLTSVQE